LRISAALARHLNAQRSVPQTSPSQCAAKRAPNEKPLSWMSRIYYNIADLLQRGCASMKSLIVKRSVVVAGHKTSVSLEDAFWKGLKEVAGERDTTLTELVGTIGGIRQSVIRPSAFPA
jgi:Ribbon-helix-helix domain